MDYKNSKTSDPHKVLINLTDKIDLKRKQVHIFFIRKSPASNDWPSIFKIADFCQSSLKVTKFGKLYHFFLI